MAPAPNDFLTQWRAEALDRALSNALFRHTPMAWAIAASKKIALQDIKGTIRWPPHWMLHSIEANCAYYHTGRDEPVTEQRLRNVYNIFGQNTPPYEEFLLEELGDIHMFMQVQFRKQIEVQADKMNMRNMLGRIHLLCDQTNAMPRCKSLLLEHYGISYDAWIALSAAGYGQASSRDGAVSIGTYHTAMPALFTEDCLAGYLSLASRTPTEIGEQYLSERDLLKSRHLDVCLRSSFLQNPIIDFGDDRLIAPQPALLSGFMLKGWEYAISQIDPDCWSLELGSAFERYCTDLAKRSVDDTQVSRPDRDYPVEGRGRCDLMIELDDCVLLIECKATQFNQRLLIREHLRRDSSSARIRDASRQLSDTAEDIRNGLIPIADHDRKSLFGIVVTLGELFTSNSDWYWEHVVQADDPTRGLEYRPQVMSVMGFEFFNALLRQDRAQISTIIRDQVEASASIMHPDWERAIPQIVSDTSQLLLQELYDAWEVYEQRLKSYLSTNAVDSN